MKKKTAARACELASGITSRPATQARPAPAPDQPLP